LQKAYSLLEQTTIDNTLQSLTGAGAATGLQFVAAYQRLTTPYTVLIELE
jgi:hypothetical protein